MWSEENLRIKVYSSKTEQQCENDLQLHRQKKSSVITARKRKINYGLEVSFLV